MQDPAIVLALLLVAAITALVYRERQRGRALALLGRRGDLEAAARAATEGRADRPSLDAALALRDAIMDASPTPVMLFDAGARLVRANRATREAIPDLEVGATAAVQEIATAVHDALAGRPPRPFDVTVYQPERRRFHAHLRTYPDRGTRCCVVVLADESAEADYRDARRLFSAGVSHELRTPLARMEVEGITGGEPANVTEAVEDCLEQHADAAQAAGLRLAGHATAGIVTAVPRRLVDVILDNLLENAIRHAGEGADIDVTARGLTGAVELSIADTGAGVPAEHLSRVFERFHRVEGSRAGPGTGLGLAIVKHIAEAHGGRAGMESVEG